MNFVISPGARTGAVRIPASKSQAHRLLICAALGKAPVTVRCDGLNATFLPRPRAFALSARTSRSGTARCALSRSKLCRTAFASCPAARADQRSVFCSRSSAHSARTRCSCGKDGCLSARSSPLLRELVRGGMMFRSEGGKLFCSGKLAPGRLYASREHFLTVYFRAALRAAETFRGQHAHNHRRAGERGLYRLDGECPRAERHPAI